MACNAGESYGIGEDEQYDGKMRGRSKIVARANDERCVHGAKDKTDGGADGRQSGKRGEGGTRT